METLKTTEVIMIINIKKDGFNIILEFDNKKLRLAEILQKYFDTINKKTYFFSKDITNSISSIMHNGIDLHDIIQPMIYGKFREPLLYSIAIRDFLLSKKATSVLIGSGVPPLLVTVIKLVCKDLRIPFSIKPKYLYLNLLLFKINKSLLRILHYAKFIILSLMSFFYQKKVLVNTPRLFLTFGYYSFEKTLNNLINISGKSLETLVITASTRFKNLSNEFAIKENGRIIMIGRGRFLKPQDSLLIIYNHILFRRKVNKLLKVHESEHIFLLNILRKELLREIILSLTTAITNICIAKRVISVSNPRILIAADDASGWWCRSFISIYKKYNIPTLTIQHGLIEDPYLYIPFSDVFCSWGRSSMELLLQSEEEIKSRLLITGSPFLFNNMDTALSDKTNVLVILTRFSEDEYDELKLIFTNLINTSKLLRQKLLIKPHPSDSALSFYREIIEKLDAKDLCSIEHGNISEIAQRSKLGFLLAPSTAMIEAIASGCFLVGIKSDIFSRRPTLNWIDKIPIIPNDGRDIKYFMEKSAAELNTDVKDQYAQIHDIVKFFGEKANKKIFDIVNEIEKK